MCVFPCPPAVGGLLDYVALVRLESNTVLILLLLLLVLYRSIACRHVPKVLLSIPHPSLHLAPHGIAHRSSRKDGCEFASWVTWPNSLLAHRLQKFADQAGKGDEVHTNGSTTSTSNPGKKRKTTSNEGDSSLLLRSCCCFCGVCAEKLEGLAPHNSPKLSAAIFCIKIFIPFRLVRFWWCVACSLRKRASLRCRNRTYLWSSLFAGEWSRRMCSNRHRE